MNGPLFSFRRCLVIVRKELLVLLGNRISRMLIIVPPLAQIVIFGWAATMEVKNVSAAYVNNDNGVWSVHVINAVKGSPTFKSVIWLDGYKEAERYLNEQKALAVLVIEKNFSAEIEKGNPAPVQILLDGRRSNAAQIVSAYLGEIIQEISRKTPLAKISAVKSRPSVNISTRCWFNPNLDFQWYFLPNLIGMITLMLGLVVTGLSVARERETGTFDQLLVSPATPLEIAIAKLTPGGIIGLIHGTIFIVIAIFGFGVPLNGSLLVLYAGMLVFAFAAGSLGLMVSSLSSTQQQAFLGAFTVGVPCILLSGAITPILNMPQFLQYATLVNPLRHFTVICQGVFLKEITTVAAIGNIIKIAIISFFSAGISIWMFKKRS